MFFRNVRTRHTKICHNQDQQTKFIVVKNIIIFSPKQIYYYIDRKEDISDGKTKKKTLAFIG